MASKLLGWPAKSCELAHAFLCEIRTANTARKGCSLPNFWADLPTFSPVCIERGRQHNVAVPLEIGELGRREAGHRLLPAWRADGPRDCGAAAYRTEFFGPIPPDAPVVAVQQPVRYGQDRLVEVVVDRLSNNPTRAERRRVHPLERERYQVGAKDASWLMHSCGSTAVNGLKLGQLLGQLGVFLTWLCSIFSCQRITVPAGPLHSTGATVRLAYPWVVNSFPRAPVYFYREYLRKYTGWCTNDVTAHV